MREPTIPDPSALQEKVLRLEETILELEHRQAFARAILDSLAAHVAVIDEKGEITAVNESWRRFARLHHAGQADRTGLGTNYLEVCRTAIAAGDADAKAALAGIESVLTRRTREFLFEYPCRTASQENWYLMRVFPLARESGGAVISHVDITVRKQAEKERETLHEQLRQANRLLETGLDSIPDIIGVQEPDHGVIRYNSAGYRFLNRTPETVRGHRCFEMIGRTELCDDCATSKACRDRQPARIERYFKETDTWLDVRAYPIIDEAGRIIQVVEHIRDISREKQIEADLLNRIEFVSLITGISTRFINLQADQLDGGINDALASIGRFAGVARCYVFRFRDGDSRMDNTHEWCADGIESHRHRLQDLTVADFPSVREHVLEGLVRHVPSVAPLPATFLAEKAEFEREGIQSILLVPMTCAGKVVGFLGFDSVRRERTWPDNLIALLRIAGEIIANGLARKSAEEARRQSEAKFRLLFDRAADAIFIVSLDGRFLEVNSVATEQNGYTRDEFLRMSLSDLDPILQPTQFRDRSQALLESGELIFESEHQRKDGTIFPVELSIRLVAFGDGPAFLSICRDISTRKRLESQLRQQERVAAVGRMAGGIAHDFNNLLTGISGIAELLQYEPDIPDDAKADIALIENQGKKAAHLVRQILDYTRQSNTSHTPTDLLPLCTEAVAFLRRTLPENIQIRFQARPGAYLVNANPVQIQQILTNLSVNAHDAMPAGGELGMGLDLLNLEQPAPPPLPGLPAGEWVVLTVADTGVGIRPEVLDNIFDPYFTTKTGGKGSGLGLAQVYGIVRQHHGFIGVVSAPGNGATFTVYLPRIKEGKLPPAEPTRPNRPAGQGETILLVEDEEVVRLLGEQILTKLGYHVRLAANGWEALVVQETAGKIDLLITDLVMPGMSGRELILELRRKEPGLKAMAITGYTVAEDRRELAEQGISEIVSKPFDIDLLASTVRRLLDSRA